MNSKIARILAAMFLLFALLPMAARAQQTLGSINGTVTDSTGGVVPGTAVRAHNADTGLEQTATTKNDGSFSIVDLPIGTYSVTFSKTGFKTDVHAQILVQANRTTTVNASMQAGEVTTTVTVNATPLINQTDTTNGYTLSSDVIESTPLGTGSFTQLAILAPGVSADLLNGSGTNAGLGNQDIFANGQRDTSNSFAFNGVNANNVFNGKSSSQVSDNRFVLSTGEHFLAGGEIQTSTSVYNAIGEGLPTPPPETIQELHVNTSMYDASQGANSGAHLELTTKSGTNNYHGQAYEYHQTDAWNAAPFFRNADPNVPQSDKTPKLHYNRFGGDFGGPIFRDKMFFYASYQGVRTTDLLESTSFLSVPVGLTNDRSTTGITNAVNSFIDPSGMCGQAGHPACFSGTIDPVAAALLNAKLPNGSFLIPSAGPVESNGSNVFLQGVPATFNASQINGNIDYNFSAKDRLAAKYYFQNNPTTSPFAISQVAGFTQKLQAGSQVISLDNTTILTPNLTWEQRAGFIRETAFATTAQPFGPSNIAGSGQSINVFGGTKFPGIFIQNPDNVTFNNLYIGPAGDQATFSNAGIFQNQWELASNLTWVRGRHTLSTGFNWDHNQLNVVNHNNLLPKLEFRSFEDFVTGTLRADTPEHTVLFNGASNRYFRSNQVGSYVQDVFRLRPNLSIDVGLRWDWDGPLAEKNGFLTNFYPKTYAFDLGTDSITNIGLVVAGTNKAFGTKGVSGSTLTGRQWGFAPRIGVVWSPSFIKNFVIRTGFGLYYDRGEFFTEFSPSAGFGFNGPFGVTLEPPFIVPCVPGPSTSGCGAGANMPTFSNPFGTSAPPPPPNNLSQVAALVPNLAGLSGCMDPVVSGCTPVNSTSQPFLFGGYDPSNKLPYSENWQFDLQWQPWNTLVMTLGYVGNRGVHETIPVPYNQPGIANGPGHSINGETTSYGYQAVDGSFNPLVSEQVNTSTGGNTDLRTPFLGYSPNSVFYKAEGISHYNALQFSVNKRLSFGLQVNGSYTWSHSLDEQSGLGLFYNGNNPLDPRSGYASSDFDRTHVLTVAYQYDLPKVSRAQGLWDKVANGWGVAGITVLESGQPYNVYDFSGSVGGLFYSANDFITNPVLPIAPGFNNGTAQLQGTTGVNAGKPVLDVNAFTIGPIFAPGTNGVPPCGVTTGGTPNICDTFETGFGATGRNTFRGPFQTRFDFSVYKNIKITERFKLRYDAQFFNLFNHPSFDTPNNNVTLNPCFNPNPCYTVPASPFQMLGVIQHTIGSPRFIQMALHLTF